MKAMVALAVLGLLGASPAVAAVSGFYDSADQINTILHNGEVADAIRQAPIIEVSRSPKKSADGFVRWNLRTEGCSVEVALVALPPRGVGKTRYEVRNVGKCN